MYKSITVKRMIEILRTFNSNLEIISINYTNIGKQENDIVSVVNKETGEIKATYIKE